MAWIFLAVTSHRVKQFSVQDREKGGKEEEEREKHHIYQTRGTDICIHGLWNPIFK